MSDNDEELQEPWDAVRLALWEWRDRFNTQLQEVREKLPSTPDFDGRIALMVEAVARVPDIFIALRDQRFTEELESLVNQIMDEPVSLHGLDGRRLLLFRAGRLSRLNLDAELIEFLVHLCEGSSEDTQKRYEALAVGALTSVRLNPIAEDYVRRSARLLLLGLDVECAVLCRASLEAALNFRIGDDLMKVQKFKPNSYGQFSLKQRIDCAFNVGLFSAENKDRAHLLRRVGNDSVHPADPEKYDRAIATADGAKAFISLSILLRRLLPIDAE